MFTMMSFIKYVAYESEHFFFLVKVYFSKNCHDRINMRSLSMKFRDKLMPMVCVFNILGSSYSWNFRLITVLSPDRVGV